MSKLFDGVCVFILGHTDASYHTISKAVERNGGKVSRYLVTGKVTHIVCKNITIYRENRLAKTRSHIPVVSSDWVFDSIKYNTKLSVFDYNPFHSTSKFVEKTCNMHCLMEKYKSLKATNRALCSEEQDQYVEFPNAQALAKT